MRDPERIRRRGTKLTILEAIRFDNLLRLVDDIRHVDTDNVLCARLYGKHAEDARPAPNVEHRFPTENVRTVRHCVFIRHRPYFIFEHLLVDA